VISTPGKRLSALLLVAVAAIVCAWAAPVAGARTIHYAGHAVVMGNASQEIRDLAHRQGWQVTDSNDEDGVALAIEEVLRVQATGQDADGNGEEAMAGSAVVQFAQ